MTPFDRERCERPCDEEEVQARMKKELPPADALQQLADTFGLLADRTRLKIIGALAVYSELCVCDISTVVELSASATSHQLRKLRDAGVVAKRRDGRLIYYRLCDETMSGLIETAIDRLDVQHGGSGEGTRITRL